MDLNKLAVLLEAAVQEVLRLQEAEHDATEDLLLSDISTSLAQIQDLIDGRL